MKMCLANLEANRSGWPVYITINFILIDTVNKLQQKEEEFNTLSSELEKLRENLAGKVMSSGDKPLNAIECLG